MTKHAIKSDLLRIVLPMTADLFRAYFAAPAHLGMRTGSDHAFR